MYFQSILSEVDSQKNDNSDIFLIRSIKWLISKLLYKYSKIAKVSFSKKQQEFFKYLITSENLSVKLINKDQTLLIKVDELLMKKFAVSNCKLSISSKLFKGDSLYNSLKLVFTHLSIF